MAVSRPSAGATDTANDHGFHPLSVARVIRETADASSFVLDVPDELRAVFAYRAGQFCTFRVRVDGRPHLRCYSMSSSPAVDPELTVTVKRTDGGVVSNFLIDQLEVGDTVEVTRPAGVFCLTGGDEDIIAFSAGSGITPVHSLLKSALTTTARTVRLFYANRDRDAVIFASELDALGAAYGERLVLSHHLDAEHGLATADAVRDFASADWGAQFYVCGPGPFMDVVERALRDGGVLEDRIHIERFTPTELVLEPLPPFSTAVGSRVTIELAGRTDSTEHRPGTTILQTARQMGMSPPFSCEAGSCATCMARVVEGMATMHVNNALTDDEVAEGWVLTCQAVPDSESVHVVYEGA